MIKIEHVVLPSSEQIMFAIEGMRNAMNSWDKSDSIEGCYIRRDPYEPCCWSKIDDPTEEDLNDECVEFVKGSVKLGQNDFKLMKNLSNAGTEQRKYMRMLPVMLRVTAPLYWWKEFDTYKVGTISNSCSTMHKIHEKEFTLDDFSYEHLYNVEEFQDCAPTLVLERVIKALNLWRYRYLETKDKEDWWQLIQLLPSSYNQTRNITLNYEVLANMYRQRKGHKLDEWRQFCEWVELLPYSELIIGGEK